MRPLEDVRVIAIEQYAAGPFGSVQLADLGADIIKIEDPASGGDIGRYVPPLQEGEDSMFFETFNRNKRSVGLDLKSPAGRAVFEDLVRVSDVVYSNLRGDVPHDLRITYADLEHLNRRIVCCTLTGFGTTGPRKSEPGYDYFLQGVAGWMDITGSRRDRQPSPVSRWSTTRPDWLPESPCLPAFTPRVATASGWTATSASSTPPWRCSPTRRSGTSTVRSRRHGRITLRIRPWFRSRHSRRATGGSWSGALRKNSGYGWSTRSAFPNSRPIRDS